MSFLKSLTLLLVAYAAGTALAQSHATRQESPLAADNGKILQIDGKPYLYGGENPDWRFEISTLTIDANKLRNGVGREHYPALIEPRFVEAGEAGQWLKPESRVIVVHIGDEAKVYPIALMIRHEAVNDIVGGVPVLPVYCTRARISAVFDRRILGHVFTFGVSGYTYADPEIRNGLEVFLFWDRDTESLWWPMMGTAVSGPMTGSRVERIDIPQWKETTWAEALAEFPHAPVLAPGQTLDPPDNFPKLSEDRIQALKSKSPGA